jgi:L-talarate/galactarate dehydratase
MVDVNQAWTAETALQAGRELEDVGLLWIEEPIDAQDYAGQARLSRELRTPIAAGETLWGRQGFQQLLDAGGVDVIQLDLMRCGGITPLLGIAELVESYGLPISSHLFTEISAHLLGTTPGGQMAEHLPSWFDPLFDHAPRIVEGRLLPREDPGIGLRLAPAAVERWEVGR